MSAREISIKLYRTNEHPCGYYRDRLARDLVLDPESPELKHVFPNALGSGFRRSGPRVYRPDCVGCRDCVSSRVVVAEFKPNRSQARSLKRNSGLRVSIEPPYCNDERLALYQRYLGSRHAGGGMDGAGAADFEQFLQARWCDTRFLCVREGERLVAAAVTDVTPIGLSAVYTFFDPDMASRSLGVFCILQQIAWAGRMGLPHLYLGYWLDGHAKMGYKQHYQPLELLREGHWQRLPTSKDTTE
ncbi:MAG: arginyltransferase [Rhodanobacteraceae bacterium]|nr:arginyltransferase [Rhodanobacteraceae bacterium]MBL0041182.1 arginyltransferase [Xanthomonadales bacterium]